MALDEQFFNRVALVLFSTVEISNTFEKPKLFVKAPRDAWVLTLSI